jgi:hypothetical protein
MRVRTLPVAVVLGCSVFASTFSAAQAPPPAATQGQPPAASTLTPILRNWTRVESWSFFEPRPPGGDPDYTFIANRLLAGLRHTAARYELVGAVQYVQFGRLPDDAIGPGPLGIGATYYDHSRRTDSHGVYLKALNVLLKQPVRGLDVRAGRMPYASGAEAASGDPAIEAVKRMRLDSRLVGEFEWSIYQRAFDGVRVDWDDRRSLHTTFAAFWPTQGGFEENAGHSLKDVRLLGGVVDVRPQKGRRVQTQAFAWSYRDTRPVAARPDNSGVRASAIDVNVTTFGGSLVGAFPMRRGRVDVLGWAALQRGDWYTDDHEAFAVALEAGHQWPAAPWRPWVRAGWNRASGDDSGADGTHETFFPLLPTARKYALSASYAFMNLDDLFAQLILRPSTAVTLRADVHRLDFVSAADLWYAGSGATRRSGTIFGYAGRRVSGRDFGVVTEGSFDWTLSPRWSINGYAGIINGGDAIRGQFSGDRLRFAYVEHVIQF